MVSPEHRACCGLYNLDSEMMELTPFRKYFLLWLLSLVFILACFLDSQIVSKQEWEKALMSWQEICRLGVWPQHFLPLILLIVWTCSKAPLTGVPTVCKRGKISGNHRNKYPPNHDTVHLPGAYHSSFFLFTPILFLLLPPDLLVQALC